ncbi:hypothetical protein GE09DRAFT_1223114 [Coniochaeta sp. 2T2.1]|nr:hypothetical protein GE09DRAFT_1223114 [Coniochaeta sp. 2T2.1]
MSGFAKLVPAFTVHVHIAPATAIGTLSTGTSLVHLPFVQDSGYLRSEPGYPIQVDAVFAHGADYVKVDQDGKVGRLEVQSVLKTAKGDALRYNYTGNVDLTSPGGKILRGESGAATTQFGDVFGRIQFETGAEALKGLENRVYVQSGRFIVEEGKPVVVEYKISEVVA